jgi:hypothetical protein
VERGHGVVAELVSMMVLGWKYPEVSYDSAHASARNECTMTVTQ